MGEKWVLTEARLGLLLVGVAVVVGGYLGLNRRPALAPPSAPHAVTTVAGAGTVEVHVSGWVVSPGVVAVPEGSLVADVIRAAGGLRPGALASALNLAAPVAAGEQLLVPGPEGSVPESGGGQATAGEGKVAINRATAAELETLPGVGPVLAARIVAYRDHNGPFQQVEDLLSVPGIGEAKLAAIRDLVSVP